MPENQKDTNGVKLHLQEAEELKKQWFSYVFSSIQRLSDKLDDLTKQVSSNKDDFTKQLSVDKEEIVRMISECKDDLKKVIDLKEDSIYDELSDIEKKIDKVKEYVKECASLELKEHITDSNDKFKVITTDVKTLSESNITMNAKLGVYVVIISVIVTTTISTLVGGLLVLFKDFLKAFLGIE